MLESLFIQLSLIIVIAVVISVLMRVLKQPLIIGYILTGILVGPYFLNIVEIGAEEPIAVFSKFGITFLLFAVGLSLKPSRVKKVGLASLLTGLGQIVFTSGVGFLLARLLGFGLIPALYIAGALTFSSTIIIIKLLSDKKEMNTLHGRVMVGFLVVQDLVAALLLTIIPLVAKGGALQLNKIFLASGLLAISIPFGVFVLSPLSKKIARAQELLFLFSIGWVLLMILIVEFFSIPIEVGALIAGATLAAFPFSEEIKARMRPLRDFFLLFFFVWIGTQMVFTNVIHFWPAVLVFSLFVLIGNPLIIMLIMRLLRYSKRTGFLSGLTGAQVSEFSLILVAMGISLGHLQSGILSLLTAVGLITIFGSTYLMIYSHKIYGSLSPFLELFEVRTSRVDADQLEGQPYDVILFGCDRIGHNLLEVLQETADNLLVIDYNPEVVKSLSEAGINAQYGDAKDPVLLDSLDLKEAKMIITTVPDFEVNSLVIGETRERNEEAVVLAASYHLETAARLYEAGASYVFLPHLLGARYASSLIREIGFDREGLERMKEEHLAQLERLEEEDFDYQFGEGLM